MEPVQGFVVVLCVQSNPAQIQKVARLQKPVVLLPGDFQAFPERIFGIRKLVAMCLDDAFRLKQLSFQFGMTGLGKLSGLPQFLIRQLWLSQVDMGQTAEQFPLDRNVANYGISDIVVAQQSDRILTAAFKSQDFRIDEAKFHGSLYVAAGPVFQFPFCVALSNGQVAAQYVGANVPRCSIRIKVRNGWPCGVASGQA